VIHTGTGHVHTVKWSGNLVAWANDSSIKVALYILTLCRLPLQIYNTSLHKHVGSVNKPESVMKSKTQSGCYLYWHPDGTLYVGWASTVMIVSFSEGESGYTVGQDCIRVVTKFDTEGTVAGVAPFGHQLAVLAYMKEIAVEGESPKPLRPEIRVLTKKNNEISSDALSITGYEQYEANDYRLVPCYPTSCLKSSNGLATLGAPSGAINAFPGEENTGEIKAKCFVQWWKDGEEPLYYVISPKVAALILSLSMVV